MNQTQETTEQPTNELQEWKNAVRHARDTIRWLERRGDKKTARIKELEQLVNDLGGNPDA